MQNTFEEPSYIAWVDKQKELITSLQCQPLVVVLRPDHTDFELTTTNKPILSLIEKLSSEGVKHIEIAWSSHPNWISLMDEVNSSFSYISLGAASITSNLALEHVSTLGLDYAMTPIWDPILQAKAIKLKQLLIPGVFSPTEIQQAMSFGCQVIKLFPASTLGIKYLHNLKVPMGSLPFMIAAGGLTIKDLNPWLDEGYGAIALGRGLVFNHQVDPQLQRWLNSRTKEPSTRNTSI